MKVFPLTRDPGTHPLSRGIGLWRIKAWLSHDKNVGCDGEEAVKQLISRQSEHLSGLATSPTVVQQSCK